MPASINELDVDENSNSVSSDYLFINESEIFTFIFDAVPHWWKAHCSLQKGQRVLIAGFGVGYSWGGTVLRLV